MLAAGCSDLVEEVFSRLDDAMPLVEGRPFPALTPGQRYEFDALGVSRPLRAPSAPAALS